MQVETMEGRVLLSTLAVAPNSHRHAREVALAARRQATAARLAEQNDGQPAPADTTGSSAVVQGSKYAVSDAWNGYWLVHSRNVAKVGLNFAKLTLSHNTRKVGGAYFKAILKGDSPRIEQLSHTNAVKQVGADFSRLSTSPGVKYVGNQFAHFGRSVADQFHRLFGGGAAKKPAKTTQGG